MKHWSEVSKLNSSEIIMLIALPLSIFNIRIFKIRIVKNNFLSRNRDQISLLILSEFN